MTLLMVQVWVNLSAALSAGGWILSGLHLFNGIRFSLVLVLALTAAWRYFWSTGSVSWGIPEPGIRYVYLDISAFTGPRYEAPAAGLGGSPRPTSTSHYLLGDPELTCPS